MQKYYFTQNYYFMNKNQMNDLYCILNIAVYLENKHLLFVICMWKGINLPWYVDK